MNISLEDAQKLIACVQSKAISINKPVTTAVVDAGGYIVALERMDGARPLQPSISTAKAYTAAVMQRPGIMLKGWQENQPGFFASVSSMGMHPIVAAEGSMTIKKDGVLIGGLGVAGGTGPEDHQICEEALSEMGFELDFEQFNSLKK
ncbi:MAG: heme-binding protein [Spongiibacteraceae bacterium]|nr:heme-binding protein [Spongiibacteraceae bacterium]